jgi:DNA-binding response OmpR family regulator
MGPLQITATHEHRYHDQHLDLDFEHKTALRDTKPLRLTRKEYAILALLIQNAGEVVTRETLLLRVWGCSNQIRTRTLDRHIRRLRKKLGEHSGTYIETIFSVGYRFQPFRAPRLIRRAPQMTALLHTKPPGLTRKEYDLLALLIQNAGEVVTRETLLLGVWGYSNQIRTRTLDVHIRRLRKKLGEHSGTYIETIFSVGYRFQPSRIEPPVVVP